MQFTYDSTYETFAFLRTIDVDVYSYVQKILFIYPDFLKNEKILIDNLKNVGKYIGQIIDLTEKYNSNLIAKENCIFDIEKDEYTTTISNICKEIDILTEQMNKDLSPYAWYLVKDIDTDFNGIWIKADYCCVLKKI